MKEERSGKKEKGFRSREEISPFVFFINCLCVDLLLFVDFLSLCFSSFALVFVSSLFIRLHYFWLRMSSELKVGVDNARSEILKIVSERKPDEDWFADIEMMSSIFKSWSFYSIGMMSEENRKIFFDSHFNTWKDWKQIEDGDKPKFNPTNGMMKEICKGWDGGLAAQAMFFVVKRAQNGVKMEKVKGLESFAWVDAWKVCRAFVALTSRNELTGFELEWSEDAVKKVKATFLEWLKKVDGVEAAFNMTKDFFFLQKLEDVERFLKGLEEAWGKRGERSKVHSVGVVQAQVVGVAQGQSGQKRYCFDCGGEWKFQNHVHDRFCGKCGDRIKAGVGHQCRFG